MKHLCGCFESQSFSGSVIQSVLNHSNFLICNRRHGSFLRDVLAQQPIEVFIASSLPAGEWSGKVGRTLELLINMEMTRKFLSIVKGQCLDSLAQRLEVTHYG